ncbi:hypothetical protein [Spirillospora sp. NBC_01491]|uniref:hypothetical protein n=1 Tax=Spirillospora sp. NBC_01491 TaxID=2976007 RepID=UPI002E30F5E7|nr:hypothetical protein [Spirillospora sp. NBC_01491]
MTLNTKILVQDKVSYRDVWVKCNQLIGATEATRFRNEQVKTWRNGEGTPQPGNPWQIGNHLGQGLCALLNITYRPDGPFRASSEACEWYCDPGCDDEHDSPPSWLQVNFDTAYGYRDEQGRGCGDLHASLIAQLGQWLDERRVRWAWQNEFTGEIHTGYDRLTDLRGGAGR